MRAQVLALRALGLGAARGRQDEQAVERLRQALELARSTGQRSEVAASERALTG